jgi:hypothetical protein
MADDERLESWSWARRACCGTSGNFIAATNEFVQAFAIPSGEKLADFARKTWQDAYRVKTDPTVTLACSTNGKRRTIHSGTRLTLHDLK